jgi:glutamyl-tRNA synthetase
LQHFNQHYIKQLNDEDLAVRMIPFLEAEQVKEELVQVLAPLVKERVKTLAEIGPMTRFIFNDVEVPESGWKPLAKEHLEGAVEVLSSEDTMWTVEVLTASFTKLIEQHDWKVGHFFMNLRLAISGQKITPPITECVVLLGRVKVLERTQTAISTLD